MANVYSCVQVHVPCKATLLTRWPHQTAAQLAHGAATFGKRAGISIAGKALGLRAAAQRLKVGG